MFLHRAVWVGVTSLVPKVAVAQPAGSCLREPIGEARVRACQIALHLNRESAGARIDFAWALLEAGRPSEAAPEFLRAAQAMPPVPSAYYGAGVAYGAMGNHEEALKHLATASRLDRKLVAAQEATTRSLIALGRNEEALAVAQRAVQAAPRRAEAHQAVALALGILERHNEARSSLLEAVRLAPNNAVLQLELGVTLQRLGEFDQALNAFAAAARLRPHNALSWGALGLTAAQLGRHQEAVTFWARARVLDSTYFVGRTEEERLWSASLKAVGPQPPADTAALPRPRPD